MGYLNNKGSFLQEKLKYVVEFQQKKSIEKSDSKKKAFTSTNFQLDVTFDEDGFIFNDIYVNQNYKEVESNQVGEKKVDKVTYSENSEFGNQNLYSVLKIKPQTKSVKFETPVKTRDVKQLRNELEDDFTYIRKSEEIQYLMKEYEDYLETLYTDCILRKAEPVFKSFVQDLFVEYNESIKRHSKDIEILKTGEEFNKQRFDKCYDSQFIENIKLKQDTVSLEIGAIDLKDGNVTRDKEQSRYEILEKTINSIKLIEEEIDYRYSNNKSFIKSKTSFLFYSSHKKDNNRFLKEDIWKSEITNNDLREEIKSLEQKKINSGLTDAQNKRFTEINKEIQDKVEKHYKYIQHLIEVEKELNISKNDISFQNHKYFKGAEIESNYETSGDYELNLEKNPSKFNFDQDFLLSDIKYNIQKYNKFHFTPNKIKDINAKEIIEHEQKIDKIYSEQKVKREDYTNAIIKTLERSDEIIENRNGQEIKKYLEDISRIDEHYSRYLLSMNCHSGNLKVFNGMDPNRNAAHEELFGKDYKQLTKDELFDKITSLKKEFKSDGFVIKAKIDKDIYSYNNPSLSFLDVLKKDVKHSTGTLVSIDADHPYIKKDLVLELNQEQLNRLNELHNKEFNIDIALRNDLSNCLSNVDYLSKDDKVIINSYITLKATFNKTFIEEYRSLKEDDRTKLMKQKNIPNTNENKTMIDYIINVNDRPEFTQKLHEITSKIYDNDKGIGEIFLNLKDSDVSVYELFAYMKNLNIISNEEIKKFEKTFINERDNVTSEILEEIKSSIDISAIPKLNKEIEDLKVVSLNEKSNNYNNYRMLLDTFSDTEFSQDVTSKFKELFPKEEVSSMNNFERLIDLRNELYSELGLEKDNGKIETISGKIVFIENSILGYSENKSIMIHNPKDAVLRECSDIHKKAIDDLIDSLKEIEEKHEKKQQDLDNNIKALEKGKGKITLPDGSRRNFIKGQDNKSEEIEKILAEKKQNEISHKKYLKKSFKEKSASFLEELKSPEVSLNKESIKKELINNHDGKMHLIFGELKDVFNNSGKEITQEQIAIFAAGIIYENGIGNMRATLLEDVENKRQKLLDLNLVGVQREGKQDKESDKIERILNSKAKDDFLCSKVEDAFGDMSEEEKLKVLLCFEKMINLKEDEYRKVDYNSYVSLIREYLNTNEDIIIADSRKDSDLLNSVGETGIDRATINGVEIPNPKEIEGVVSMLNDYISSSDTTDEKKAESNIELLNGFSKIFYDRDLSDLKNSELENLKEVLSKITNDGVINRESFAIDISSSAGEELAKVFENYKDNNKVLCVSLYPSNICLDEFSNNKERVTKNYSEAINQSILSKLNSDTINISDCLTILNEEITKINKDREINSGKDVIVKYEIYKSITSGEDYTDNYNKLSPNEKVYANEIVKELIKSKEDINLLKNQEFIMENPDYLKTIIKNYDSKDFIANLNFEKPEISELMHDFIKDNYSEYLLKEIQEKLTSEQLSYFAMNLENINSEDKEFTDDLIKKLSTYIFNPDELEESRAQQVNEILQQESKVQEASFAEDKSNVEVVEEKSTEKQVKFIETCNEIEKECLNDGIIDIDKVVEIYNDLDSSVLEEQEKRRHINTYIFSQNIEIDGKKLELPKNSTINENMSELFNDKESSNITVIKEKEPESIVYEKINKSYMDVSKDVDSNYKNKEIEFEGK